MTLFLCVERNLDTFSTRSEGKQTAFPSSLLERFAKKFIFRIIFS